MYYSDIFSKIKQCDEISLEYQDLNNVLYSAFLKHPAYKQFDDERHLLRKELDKLYSKKYRGVYSLRVLYNGGILKSELYGHSEDIGLSIDELDDIFSKIQTFYDKWASLESELETYANGLDFVQCFITSFGLTDFFLGSTINGIYKISGVTSLKLRIRFAINEESKKCFINFVKTDVGSMNFEDPAISHNGQNVFSSVSHEGYYFFKEI